MMPALQITGQEQDQEDDQNQPDETAASGERIISTPIADTPSNYSENQNYDDDQYEKTHNNGLLLRNTSCEVARVYEYFVAPPAATLSRRTRNCHPGS